MIKLSVLLDWIDIDTKVIVVDEEGNLKDIMYPLIFDVNSKDYQIQRLMALGVGIMQVTIANYQGIK